MTLEVYTTPLTAHLHFGQHGKCCLSGMQILENYALSQCCLLHGTLCFLLSTLKAARHMPLNYLLDTTKIDTGIIRL
jgi:hypothetical protein